MGFGIPAAIGVQFAHPEADVLAITGDGSIMMNIQELATIKRYNLPVKILLINNQQLGLVRQQQELFYDRNYSQIGLADNPDFALLAAAFGFETRNASSLEDVMNGCEWLLDQDGPAFLQYDLTDEVNVWPVTVPGASNDQRLEGPEKAAASAMRHSAKRDCRVAS